MPTLRLTAALAVTAAMIVCAGAAAAKPAVPTVTHGVVVGDVRSSSAVLWARSDREATLNVALSGGRHGRIATAPSLAENDYTARIPLDGLAPGTTYAYRAWFSLGAPGFAHGPAVEGSFQTAPAANTAAPLRLDFGGDLAGQNVCRDVNDGFPALDAVRVRHPDVFVGLGDMIYADNACAAVGLYGNAQLPGDFGPAADLPTFWKHWRYGRAEPKEQRLLAGTDYVGVWDDHEVVNDFGPLTDTRSDPPYTPGVHLMPLGLEAFLDYTPVTPFPNDPHRLYRSIRWGKNVEVFVLDTRQYRDANYAEDSETNPKTMLGAQQKAWLENGLANSDSKWKVIVSSVPMSVPTGFPAANGRDGWANYDQNTGYEHELIEILRFMQSHGIDNTTWITTDVHFAEAFRYVPFADDQDFTVTELITGPMNSGIFPNPAFDTTLSPERLTFFAPPSAVTTWADAKHWLNFGELDFARDGALTMRIINSLGEVEFERTLTPS
jgi:alkaline phosphatase D